MWGWWAIFAGLIGPLISIASIQTSVIRLTKLSEAYLNKIRIAFVFLTTLIGVVGLVDRLKNEAWLRDRVGIVEKVNAEQKWKRASQFRITGSFNSMCDSGDHLCGNLMKDAYEFIDGAPRPNCHVENYKKWEDAIIYEPLFPYSYYFLSKCYLEDGRPEWKAFALKSKEIVVETTKIVGHDQAQDSLLSDLIAMLEPSWKSAISGALEKKIGRNIGEPRGE